jgi:cob(I)alamin adenosyltransferase
MVKLDRIYTGGGDSGDTSLTNGDRVKKNHLRVEAYGGVSELNAYLGVLLADAFVLSENDNQDQLLHAQLRKIQNQLFDIGSDLSRPGFENNGNRIDPVYVKLIEAWIDLWREDLSELSNFILPGGNQAGAGFHFACTICRRVERHVVALSIEEAVNPQVLIYLNRLSDLLFVMARLVNDAKYEILWDPGNSGI